MSACWVYTRFKKLSNSPESYDKMFGGYIPHLCFKGVKGQVGGKSMERLGKEFGMGRRSEGINPGIHPPQSSKKPLKQNRSSAIDLFFIHVVSGRQNDVGNKYLTFPSSTSTIHSLYSTILTLNCWAFHNCSFNIRLTLNHTTFSSVSEADKQEGVKNHWVW